MEGNQMRALAIAFTLLATPVLAEEDRSANFMLPYCKM
jgi:hypothetical protein